MFWPRPHLTADHSCKFRNLPLDGCIYNLTVGRVPNTNMFQIKSLWCKWSVGQKRSVSPSTGVGRLNGQLLLALVFNVAEAGGFALACFALASIAKPVLQDTQACTICYILLVQFNARSTKWKINCSYTKKCKMTMHLSHGSYAANTYWLCSPAQNNHAHSWCMASKVIY